MFASQIQRRTVQGVSVLKRQRFFLLPTFVVPPLQQEDLLLLQHQTHKNQPAISLFHSSPFPQNDAAAAPAPPAKTNPKYRLSKEQVAKVDKIFHKILWLDMLEAHLLIEEINRRTGLVMTDRERKQLQKVVDQDEAKLSPGGDGDAGQEEGAPEAEAAPKIVEVRLVGFDAANKIKVIKEVRAIAGLGLKEAKELVESLPKVVQKDLKPEQAEEIKAKLEAVGAQVEIA